MRFIVPQLPEHLMKFSQIIEICSTGTTGFSNDCRGQALVFGPDIAFQGLRADIGNGFQILTGVCLHSEDSPFVSALFTVVEVSQYLIPVTHGSKYPASYSRSRAWNDCGDSAWILRGTSVVVRSLPKTKFPILELGEVGIRMIESWIPYQRAVTKNPKAQFRVFAFSILLHRSLRNEFRVNLIAGDDESGVEQRTHKHRGKKSVGLHQGQRLGKCGSSCGVPNDQRQDR